MIQVSDSPSSSKEELIGRACSSLRRRCMTSAALFVRPTIRRPLSYGLSWPAKASGDRHFLTHSHTDNLHEYKNTRCRGKPALSDIAFNAEAITGISF